MLNFVKVFLVKHFYFAMNPDLGYIIWKGKIRIPITLGTVENRCLSEMKTYGY
jgi:hypothetical protein